MHIAIAERKNLAQHSYRMTDRLKQQLCVATLPQVYNSLSDLNCNECEMEEGLYQISYSRERFLKKIGLEIF